MNKKYFRKKKGDRSGSIQVVSPVSALSTKTKMITPFIRVQKFINHDLNIMKNLKKLNLFNIDQLLTREQLKQVYGGSGGSGGSGATIKCENDVLGVYECWGTMAQCVEACSHFNYCGGCWQFQ
ncbi:hypothetical protein GCM10023231_00900 [Olivibacter ginsenosidimutans]|uniref:Bacteriocin n=1 Tax=Olivibacter ginsenosidimutans TaxID=1176537 RepID=A0ABP9AE10_9SPHI